MTVDVVAYDRSGTIRLLVEVKRKIGATPDWAAQMRRNLLAHAAVPAAEYFLLVTSEHIFLWANRAGSLEPTAPDYSCATEAALKPYIGDLGLGLGGLTDASLELAVGNWLTEITRGFDPAAYPDDVQRLLRDSHLGNALVGGRVRYEANL
jgi:hypothetical protein